jgi:antitoxin ParD1/3/4
MARQSISITEPNDLWLSEQVSTNEYSSKSEVVNDLIRKARKLEQENELIRQHFLRSEKSGYSTLTAKDIAAEHTRRRNG